MAPRPKNPPADRRQEILEAALRLFAQRGYNATTNADIAREAGVTAAALYYYFPSKELLFRTAVSELRSSLLPRVVPMVERVMDMDPEILLPKVLRGVIDFFSEPRTQAILKIIMAEGQRDPAIVKIWEEQMVSVVEVIFPYLLRQMARGRVKQMDPRVVFFMVQGPIMAAVITRDILGIPMLQDVTNEMIVQGIVETTLASLLTNPE